MKNEEKLFDEIVLVIKRHCSRIAEGPTGSIGSYANHVLEAYSHCFQAVGKSPDVEALEELERSLRNAVACLSNLNIETKSGLNQSIPCLEHDLTAARANQLKNAESHLEKHFIDVLTSPKVRSDSAIILSRHSSLETLLEGVRNLRKEQAYKTKSTKKQDYRALAVVWACRKIWREECNIDAPEQNWREYPKQPPKTINPNHKNTPFTCFAEDMFKVCGITTRPRSALAALERAGGEEALSLSVANG